MSSFLWPNDDGWPYPDSGREEEDLSDEYDDDALSIRAPAHMFDSLDALKAWRSSAAKASGVPAYVIFHDTTLAAVAEAKPRDRAALLALPGLGPVKAERYGEAILALVAQHAVA